MGSFDRWLIVAPAHERPRQEHRRTGHGEEEATRSETQ
jgi:hypothetical protein